VNLILDERRGRPSASAARRLQDCPPSHDASRAFKSESTPQSLAGTDQHTYMAGGKIKLEPELLSSCKEAEQQKADVMDFVFPDWQNNPPTIVLEERMWMRGDRYSGVPDLIAIRNGTALIVDYKFGRVKVEAAQDNAQLKWLAVLVDEHYKVDEITVVIIQPPCGNFTMGNYDRAALKRARRSVQHTLRKVESGKGRFNPGEKQCQYCSAREACPALAKKIQALSNVTKVEALSPVQMANALDILAPVESACRAIRKRATDMLKEDADAIPGYLLKRGFSRRSITDTAQAYHAMKEAGLAGEYTFLQICSVSVGKLQKLVEQNGAMGPTDAKKTINEMLNGNLAVKEGEPKPCRAEL